MLIVVNFIDELDDDVEQLNKLKVWLKNELKKIDCSTDNLFYVSSRQGLVYRLNDQGYNLTKRQLLDLPANLECTGIVELENAIHKMLNGTNNI